MGEDTWNVFWNPEKGIVNEAPTDKIADDKMAELVNKGLLSQRRYTIGDLFFVLHESEDGKYEASDLETFGTFYLAQMLFGLWLDEQ